MFYPDSRAIEYQIVTPTLTITGEPDQVTVPLTMTTSAFATTPENLDTHVSTDWQIQDTAGNTVWQSLADTTNLTSITVSANLFSSGTTYLFRVRHNGNAGSSQWQEKQATLA
jgi:hypothetical protein